MAYKLVAGGVIKDGLLAIPANEDNADWRSYLEWAALGNTAEAADPLPPPTEAQISQTGAKAWFDSHPNAALLFNLSIVDLDAEIDSLVNDLFPIASAANKNRLKLWMKTVSHAIRALAKREGFT